jgi:hypothetical protein
MDAAALARWCERALASPPARILFESGYLSQVLGVELDDGRRVVVKVRPWADRLVACARVHSALFDEGFPCPQPITGVDKFDEWAVSAEALVEDYELLTPAADSARLFAEGLARLVDVARLASADLQALQPSPPWAAWDGSTRRDLWPDPDDRSVDLNELPFTWLDAVAATVRDWLLQRPASPVVGHLDWYSANVGWRDRSVVAVFDWDSIGAQPEPAIAGLAAAVWTTTDDPGEGATVEQSHDFLDTYADIRHWSDSDLAMAWAAGLWVRCFDAKKATASGHDPETVIMKSEARHRLRLAGLEDDLKVL